MQAVHDAHDDSENFLELLNSRTLAPAHEFGDGRNGKPLSQTSGTEAERLA
jgi:hypothetical protein